MRRIDNGRRGERKSRESKAERAKFLLTTHVKETKKRKKRNSQDRRIQTASKKAERKCTLIEKREKSATEREKGKISIADVESKTYANDNAVQANAHTCTHKKKVF